MKKQPDREEFKLEAYKPFGADIDTTSFAVILFPRRWPTTSRLRTTSRNNLARHLTDFYSCE